ncbi:ABC transporter F family member 4 [Tripterygium wilfordii]|uniref:ABC transporter F family member 4 n=1 Tax=Tripterygium wilfordii TaxID=458696 RepID=A0A7J7DU56_TRIWF|nr:ABC transporter F family member 4 [Tripterygium wilfordii]
MDASVDKEIEQQLMKAGNRLGEPPSSVDDLLALLDQLEKYLKKVDQVPKKSMLDALECDALIIEMFRHFLEKIRNHHPEKVFLHMELIMTCILQETDDITVELISPILASVKNNEGVLPIAWKLGETVLKNSASRLKPCLIQAVKTLGISLDEYGKVVHFICEEISVHEHEDFSFANEHIAKGSKMIKASSVDEAEQVKEEIETEDAFPEQVDPTNGKSSKPVGDPQIGEDASLVHSDSIMPSAADGAKKASEGTGNSEAKLQRCSGKAMPTRTSNGTPTVVESFKRENRIENDAEAKPPKQLAKKVDSLSKIRDGISPIRSEDRRHGNAVSEKVGIEDSTKDDEELISSPK